MAWLLAESNDFNKPVNQETADRLRTRERDRMSRFPELERPLWARYGLAVLATAAALYLTSWFWPVFRGSQFMPMVLAIFLSGWFGGGGPSFLAAILGAVGIGVLFETGDPGGFLRMLLYLAVAAVASALHGQLWRTKRQRAQLTEESESARRGAEGAHRDLGQILESLTDGFCALDQNYRCTYLNRQAEEILGRPREELLGKNALEEYPLEEKELRFLRRAMEEKEAGQFEVFYPVLRRWFDVRVAPAADGVSILFQDISKRKQSEEALERLAAVVESSEDAIIAKTLDGRISAWNAGAERLFGYSAEQILGQPVTTLMPADRRDEMNEVLKRIKRGERVEHFETIRVKKNGETVPISLSVSPIKDGSGRIVGAAKIARDISERRKAEAAIFEAQRQLTMALEAARMGTWSWDIRSGKLDWSENLLELHGLAPGTFGGTYEAFLECIHPEDRPRVDSTIRRAVEERSIYDTEFRVPFPDGSTRWVAGHGQVFTDSDGSPTRMIGIGRDITDRKVAEIEQARLFQESREAVRVRDAFLSVAGHEFRTPLAALDLTLHNLMQKTRKGGGADLLGGMQRVERQVDRLVRLTDHLLEVASIDAGRLSLEPEPTDLTGLLGEITERLEETARRAGSPLEVAASEPVVGTWDRSRLDQVVTNLLTNAVKFGAGQPVEIAVRREDGTVHLTVRDHGIGIPAADQTRIFERFERAVSDKSYSGMGLGLWISRQIVEAHGGRLRVDSEPGKGATFHVELPGVLTGEASDASSDRG
jgi:PAS domain S-box-containing protein